MEANTAMQVNAVIDHIADKLAVPSAKLMELLPAMGVVTLLKAVCFALIGGFAVYKLIKFSRTIWRETRDEVGRFLGAGICALVAGLIFVCLVDWVAAAALWLYSPEAWAVRYVFNNLFAGE